MGRRPRSVRGELTLSWCLLGWDARRKIQEVMNDQQPPNCECGDRKKDELLLVPAVLQRSEVEDGARQTDQPHHDLSESGLERTELMARKE